MRIKRMLYNSDLSFFYTEILGAFFDFDAVEKRYTESEASDVLLLNFSFLQFIFQ